MWCGPGAFWSEPSPYIQGSMAWEGVFPGQNTETCPSRYVVGMWSDLSPCDSDGCTQMFGVCVMWSVSILSLVSVCVGVSEESSHYDMFTLSSNISWNWPNRLSTLWACLKIFSHYFYVVFAEVEAHCEIKMPARRFHCYVPNACHLSTATL